LRKTAKITAVLSNEVYDSITGLAEKQRRTLSQMVALICEDYLREHGHLPKD
jgi:hypothetical protein